MDLGEVKQLIYEMVARYHPGALIVWQKTKGVTPRPPYITLGYNNLERSLFLLPDDESEHKYYNYTFTLEINLYTIGREIKVNGVGTGAYENTAVEDLEEFVRFLESEAITNELAMKGVSVVLTPPIRDFSELIGDTKFHYRSMAEFVVAYTGLADGEYGVQGSKLIPNPSGGGTKEMAEAGAAVIETVEITEGGLADHEE